MIVHVAIHDAVVIADGDARESVRTLAKEAGFRHVSLINFCSAIDFVDLVTAKSGQLVEMVVLPYDLPGLSGVQAVTEARCALPYLYAIVIDESPDHAAEAFRFGIDGYLVQPLYSADFERILKRAFDLLFDLCNNSQLLNVREGLRRVPFNDIVYCETSGHDQLLHLRDGRTMVGRYSSQALFELLATDKRFFKVGSSYIVNLLDVSRLHTSSGDLTLFDGTSIPVPQRLRKSLEEALLA